MKVKIANKSELRDGVLSTKFSNGFQVCLLLRNDTVFAFEDICSHDGESISDGELKGNCIVCPRHMAEFDIKTGEALSMPATEPIQIFPVSIVGDEIIIELEDF